jgi:hypothetical protein
MAKLVVFPCPTCGASMSADDSDASARCQFCGNTATVPAELRSQTPEPSVEPHTRHLTLEQVSKLQGTISIPGMPGSLDVSRLKELTAAARAGDKAKVISLYQELFGMSLADAQMAADKMGTGERIVLSRTHVSLPVDIKVTRSAQLPTSTGEPGDFAGPSAPRESGVSSGPPAPTFGVGPPPRRNTALIVMFVLVAIGAVLVLSLSLLLPAILSILGPTVAR